MSAQRLDDYLDTIGGLDDAALDTLAADTCLGLLRAWGALRDQYRDEVDALTMEYEWRGRRPQWDAITAAARARREAELRPAPLPAKPPDPTTDPAELLRLNGFRVARIKSTDRWCYERYGRLYTQEAALQLAAQGPPPYPVVFCPNFNCRQPLDLKRCCWRCCDRLCPCGKLTGSALIGLCVRCGNESPEESS
jgi:hypothetical protein